MISVLEAGTAMPFPLWKESVLKRLQDLGAGESAAEKAVSLLVAGGGDAARLEERVELFIALTKVCKNMQNAKLAYSLGLRSEVALDACNISLLAGALRHSDCVPAAVRLWKAAATAGVREGDYLSTAASLGENGAEQIRVLNLLKAEPQKSVLASKLARRLRAPGWHAEGSWGTYYDEERGAVWWDYARPRLRRTFGMTLSCDPVEFEQKLGAQFLFSARTDITGTTDRCHLEVSTDGSRWNKLLKFGGVSDWTEYRVDLSRFRDRKVYLRFNVLTGGHRAGQGMELASPRIEMVPVSTHRPLDLTMAEGWSGGAKSLTSYQAQVSEKALLSEPFEVSQMAAPTLSVETRMASSSAFAEARLELLDESDQVASSLVLEGTSDWKQRTISFPHCCREGRYRLRLWSRFVARKPDDGFWVRRPSLLAGSSEELQTLALDGSVEDGAKERKALLGLLEHSTLQDLEKLYHLRQGLPSLRAALALSSVVENESQIPALLSLFSNLGEEALAAFAMLKELAVEEDLTLQAQVLLAAGLLEYPSTRDHLGAGLLSGAEYEAQCRLYLKLRERWSERDSRSGLSLLLTPIADEELKERSERFESLLELHADPDALFAAWDKGW